MTFLPSPKQNRPRKLPNTRFQFIFNYEVSIKILAYRFAVASHFLLPLNASISPLQYDDNSRACLIYWISRSICWLTQRNSNFNIYQKKISYSRLSLYTFSTGTGTQNQAESKGNADVTPTQSWSHLRVEPGWLDRSRGVAVKAGWGQEQEKAGTHPGRSKNYGHGTAKRLQCQGVLK